MQKKWVWIGVLVAGLLLGTVLSFPYRRVSDQLFDVLRRQAGVDIQSDQISLGLGLGLGWRFGGLLAFHSDRTRIRMRGLEWDCERLSASPHLWRLLLLEFQVGIRCEVSSKQESELNARIRVGPLWAPEKLGAEFQVQNLDLSNLSSLVRQKLQGRVTGNLKLADFVLSSRKLGALEWSLLGQGLESPPLQTNFFNIPGVKFGSLESRGTWAEQSLKVPVLKFGEDDGPIFGEFSVDLKLDRAMNPQGGSVSGKLKTDPEFEKTEIRDLDLNDLFGGVNSEGWRSFRKEASGSWMFMLEKPKNPSG